MKMTYEEYLEKVDESAHAEWVDGEVTIFMPPSAFHQRIARFLTILLSEFADAFDLGELFFAPFEMKLREGRSYREPDLLFVLSENFGRLEEARLVGPADVAIEIISKESVGRDRRDKYREYEDAGVREYWTFDARPGRRRVVMFLLTSDGHYEEIVPDAHGRLRSTVIPGFWIEEAWFASQPLPKPSSILRQMIPQTRVAQANGDGDANLRP